MYPNLKHKYDYNTYLATPVNDLFVTQSLFVKTQCVERIAKINITLSY